MKSDVQMMEDLVFDVGPKTVTICGKIKFDDKIRQLAASLENDAGWNILIPINIKKDTKKDVNNIDNIRYIHFDKIHKSNAILVYVDDNYEFLESKNVMSEILAALSYEKEIYFSKVMNDEAVTKITQFVNTMEGAFNKKFKVKRFIHRRVSEFNLYELSYRCKLI